MNKKKLLNIMTSKKVVPLLTLAAMVITFGVTWTYYNEEQVLANPLKTSHSGAAIVEEFNPDSSFLPGETVIKKVAFKNTGDMDVFLRVEVPPAEGWYYASEVIDKDGTIHNAGSPASNLETQKVIKGWNGKDKDDKEIWMNGETPKELDGLSIEYNMETDYWSEVYSVKESDGNTRYYRYYKRILAPGAVTDDILNDITLSTDISNDRHGVNYSNKIYHLTFNAEAVPVEEHDGEIGVPTIWNMVVIDMKEKDDKGDKISWKEAIDKIEEISKSD